MSFSRFTILGRVKELSGNTVEILQMKVHNFQCFSFNMDVRDTVQLNVFLRGIDMEFSITDELVALSEYERHHSSLSFI